MSGRPFTTRLRNRLGLLLNPALCQICSVPVAADHFLCQHCLHDMERVPNPCRLCGLPNVVTETLCPACQLHPPRWSRMVAPLVYAGSARRLIQRFKFDEQIHLANSLLTHLTEYYRSDQIDVLLPVPLHTGRLLERGFNQSAEIANLLSWRIGIPLDRNALQRVRATESQAGLNLSKRRKNILQAFKCRSGLSYRSVAVVDDVITTGSTVAEACKVLHRAGIEQVEVWGLARALKHD